MITPPSRRQDIPVDGAVTVASCLDDTATRAAEAIRAHWKIERVNLTRHRIQKIWLSIEISDFNRNERLETLAVRVIENYLGEDWVEKHILHPKLGLLHSWKTRTDLQAPKTSFDAFELIVLLPEMLYNFQRTPGFDKTLTLLRDPKKIISTISMFEIAASLR